MMVKFNNPQGLQVNTAFNLLENRYDTNPSNTHCNPSISIRATYLGLAVGSFSWRFDVTMRGENGATSSMQANINTNDDNEYFQINVYFGGNNAAAGNVQSGNVVRWGNLAQQAGQSSAFQSDNRNLGAHLARVKCGFAICRNFSGALRQFAVYEGCGNFNNIQ